MDLNDSPTGNFARRAEKFAEIHRHAPSRSYVKNLETSVELLRCGDLALPCTINHAERGNAWVCSPSTTYGSYVIEEIRRCLPLPAALPLSAICFAYRQALKLADIDKVVAINNWMLSTNIFPDVDHSSLLSLIDQALQRWPRHAIWFRSLNMRHNSQWIEALCERGFQLIPSRQVYLFRDMAHTRHANLKRDLHLLERTQLTSMAPKDFKTRDFARVAELYDYLYIEKYSRLNPQYTAEFMQRWHENGLLDFWGFRDGEGILQAVVGIFRQQNTITAPIVGYNTLLPQSLGLYRLLMARVFEVSMRGNLDINLSAGAAQFKRLRGGQPEIEYSAVLTQHLGGSHRIALATLRTLTNSVGVPLMKRFQL
jgi:hypothetical protein